MWARVAEYRPGPSLWRRACLMNALKIIRQYGSRRVREEAAELLMMLK